MDRLALPAKSTASHRCGEAPEQVALREALASIIRSEYSGDIQSEFWRAPARKAAARIVELLRR